MATGFELSPKSPLVTMREYLPEFDPDHGPTPTDQMPAPTDVFKAWKMYLNSFDDLCRLQGLDEADPQKKRGLLLLLAGLKLRSVLEDLGDPGDDYAHTVSILNAHFYEKRNLRTTRYNLLYCHGRPLPGETIQQWCARLCKMAEQCHFSSMSASDVALLVMCHFSQNEAIRSQILSTSVSTDLAFTLFAQLNDEVEEDDVSAADTSPSANIENGEVPNHMTEAIAVELNWGGADNDEEDDGLLPQSVDAHRVSMLDSMTVKHNVGDFSDTNTMDALPPVPDHIKDTPATPSAALLSPSPSKRAPPKSTCPCLHCQNPGGGGNRKTGKHLCPESGCGKQYSKPSHLRAHMASHSDVMPFACKWPNCGRAFYRSDQLARHERTHTGEKKFACKVCHKAFSRSDHMKKHERSHGTAAASLPGVVFPQQLMGHQLENDETGEDLY